MSQVNNIFLRYVGRLFLSRFLGLLTFFIIILQMLDLLNESTDIMSASGADWSSIAKYISLRAPQIASQFAPFAALLAIVATLSSLNQRCEITIMRAAGMSVHRVLFPIGIVCAGITVLHFVFHETVTVRASERLAYWSANGYEVGLAHDSSSRTNIRISHDGEFIRAGVGARENDRVRLGSVVIYSLDERGLVYAVTEARAAIYRNGQWVLQDATRLDATTLVREQAAVLEWPTTLTPDTLFARSMNPDQTSLPTLVRRIDALKRDRADERSAATSLLSRFSKPMSTIVMPLLGAIAGFGVARQGNQLLRGVLGAALGFGYFVSENLLLALGKLGVVPGVFGSFFTFSLFLVVGLSILLTMEN